MMQLTRIEPGSLAIACALLGFFLGLLAILVVSALIPLVCLGYFFGGEPAEEGPSLSFSSEAVIYALPLLGAERMDSLIKSVLMSLGPLTIILGSFFFAVVGLIGGFVTAVIYNLVAVRFGGITIRLDEYVPPEKPVMKEVTAEEVGEEPPPEQVQEEVPPEQEMQEEAYEQQPTEEQYPPEQVQSQPPRQRRRQQP